VQMKGLDCMWFPWLRERSREPRSKAILIAFATDVLLPESGPWRMIGISHMRVLSAGDGGPDLLEKDGAKRGGCFT
jgi:hypothetical protein